MVTAINLLISHPSSYLCTGSRLVDVLNIKKKSSEIVFSLCTPCVCSATTAWPMSASTPCFGQPSSQSCCSPVQHGADSSQRLTDIASTRSSAVANAAVATVSQTSQLSANFGCFTNSVVVLEIHYTTFSHHPPRHHNTTTSGTSTHNRQYTSTHRPPHRRQLHHTLIV